MRVVDKNSCKNCRRPIEKIEANSGTLWLHTELPHYAHEKITCSNAVPVDPRCRVCGELVAGSNVGIGYVSFSSHGKPGKPICVGSGTVQPRPE